MTVTPTVVGNVELFALAALLLAFVTVYAATTRWWRGEAGANVMAFMFVLLLVVGLAIVRVLAAGGSTAVWFAWLRVGVFALVPLVAAWRLWLLVRVQVLRRRK